MSHEYENKYGISKKYILNTELNDHGKNRLEKTPVFDTRILFYHFTKNSILQGYEWPALLMQVKSFVTSLYTVLEKKLQSGILLLLWYRAINYACIQKYAMLTNADLNS